MPGRRPALGIGPALPLLLLLLVRPAPGPAAGAAEPSGGPLRVLAAGATESTFRDVVGDFERAQGMAVSVTFGAVGDLRDRLLAGERADLVIATPVILDELERRGLVASGSRAALGRVGGGIAVCAGAPRPAVGTPEELRAALLAARTVHFADPARATAGAHLVEVAEKLGIAAEVRARGRVAPGGKAAMEAMAGDCAGAIGLTQASEILSVPAVALVGPYPASLQRLTTYAGAPLAASARREPAEALLRFLRGPPAQARFARAGFEPVP